MKSNIELLVNKRPLSGWEAPRTCGGRVKAGAPLAYHRQLLSALLGFRRTSLMHSNVSQTSTQFKLRLQESG